MRRAGTRALVLAVPVDPVHAELRPLRVARRPCRRLVRRSRAPRASSCGGRRARRRAAGAAPPPGSTCTGRTRSTRRTRRRRGRTIPSGAARPRRSPRQLELEIPRLRAAAPRRLELRRREVDADDARAAPREPGAEVRRPAAELDDVLARRRRRGTPHLRLGSPHIPQVISSRAQASRARASVYSAFAFVQTLAVLRSR